MTKLKPDISTSKNAGASGLSGSVFGKKNYFLLLAGVLTMGVGYILMIGGKTTDPAVFNPSELYHPLRITVAPAVILTGIIICGVSIFYRER